MHFLAGVIGTGLLLLSQHPILDSDFGLFTARGDPAAVMQGDWLAGKGVGWAALQTPGARPGGLGVGGGVLATTCSALARTVFGPHDTWTQLCLGFCQLLVHPLLNSH